MPDSLPVLAFESPEAWDAWLTAHHASSPGVWLKIAKKGSGIPSVDYSQALDVALCHGWIDGQKAGYDGDHWLQRFTPRKGASKWSRINTQRAEALIRAGRMRQAGLREMERAKADGRWDAAYASQATATVPDDLARRWLPTSGPQRSSPPSTVPTGMRSCTGLPRPSARRPAPGASPPS